MSSTRPDGQQITLTYDGAGRVSSRVLPTGTFSVSYDSVGQVQGVSAPSGANIANGYDGSLLTSTIVTGPVPGTITWTYDPDFRVTSQSVNSSHTITFSYDADSLLTGAGDLTLSRDPQNRLLMGTTLGNVADVISYNPFAEPTDYQATVNTLPVFHQSYVRDSLGRIIQKTETIDGTTNTYGYTYDTAGRLTEVKLNGVILSAYTYDPNGNRLSKTAPVGTLTGTYDAQDRLLTYNGNTYTYTANGELASKANSQSPNPISYSYDVLGNLLADLG